MTRTLEPELLRAHKAISALLQPNQRVTLGGRTQSAAAWLRQLDAALARKAAIQNAEFAVRKLRRIDLHTRKDDRALLARLHGFLRGCFGNGHGLLNGLKIPKAPGRPTGSKPTALVQAQASAQMVATKRRRYKTKAEREALRAPPVTIEIRAADGTLLARHGPPPSR